MSEQEIDAQLKEMLNFLRPVPRRSSDAMHHNRSRFYADLDTYFPVGASPREAIHAPLPTPAATVPKPAAPAAWPVAPATRPAATTIRPKTLVFRSAYVYLSLALLIVVAMLSGSIVTVFAADSALPGDALYPFKLDVEQARLSLTSDPARQADLYLEFAQNRLVEMNALAELGQYSEIAPLTAQFNLNAMMAVRTARRFADREPERALRVENQVAMSLGQLKKTVGLAILMAPFSMQPALQAALDQAAQLGPALENANANENNGVGNGNAGNANNNPANQKPNPNSGGAPGSSGNNNPNPNPNANPNSTKDKDKDKDKVKDKDKDKDKDK